MNIEKRKELMKRWMEEQSNEQKKEKLRKLFKKNN